MRVGTGIAKLTAAQAPRLSLKREIGKIRGGGNDDEKSEASINDGFDDGGRRPHGPRADERVWTKERQPPSKRGAKGQGTRQTTTAQQQ